MSNLINVVTKYNEELVISEVHLDLGTPQDKIVQYVIRLQDEGVRKALIELGWTPPND